jgi:hypothetical protein
VEQVSERLASSGGAVRRSAPRRGTIRRDGTRWEIALDGRRVRVPDLVGVRYLADLLTTPGRSVPALALASGGTVPSPSRQFVLDDEARAAYAARARELSGDLAEAEADNDLARAEKLRVELDALVDQVESATGLRGRSRAFADPAERARSSVSKAIKRAIAAVDDADPTIAEVLHGFRTATRPCSCSPTRSAARPCTTTARSSAGCAT